MPEAIRDIFKYGSKFEVSIIEPSEDEGVYSFSPSTVPGHEHEFVGKKVSHSVNGTANADYVGVVEELETELLHLEVLSEEDNSVLFTANDNEHQTVSAKKNAGMLFLSVVANVRLCYTAESALEVHEGTSISRI